ncbi:serine-protein kinase RsbW [Pullulanibacillus camelliae]|uniref:Serine-protein kinase RsbW n=1 Tax=Pullulanibacillus camelliae TaxID=1707096 RepID=A0A8J2VNE8_9BACL|nr:anti-sigma B factor RsbW [Pullulanibacillus camelliae]GGE34454.1 serine-protein kinase RsbW [Pullulanibacillus camelliae]
MKPTSDTIELTIPAKAEYIGVVRLTASGVANRMGYPYDAIEDIKVAISEAITNAVNHAYSEDEEGEVAVRFQLLPDRLEIMVADKGRSFNVNAILEEMKPLDASASLEELSEGGLGLFLIDTLMDQVTFNNDSGIAVIMTKFLQRDEVELHADRIKQSYDRPVGR